MPDAGTMESYDGLSERAGSPTGHMEQEKRIRREIANSNERRRMQSINAGFQSLRTLLPQHEGEKLSKAAILQQTAEYIYTLEQEKTRLLSQNCQLKRIINQHEGEASSAHKKRKTEAGPVTIVAAATAVSESSDEGIGSMSPEPVAVAAAPGATAASIDHDREAATEALRREVMDLRVSLDRERRMRLVLESQVRSLETQIYPAAADSDRIRELQPVQLQYHPDMETWQDEQPIEEGVYTVKTEVELPHSMIHQSVLECDGAASRREALAIASVSVPQRSLIQETEEAVAQIQAQAQAQATTIVTAACSTSPMYAVESGGDNLALAMAPSGALATPMASPCPSPVALVAPPLSPEPRPLALAVAALAVAAVPTEQRLPSALEAAIKAEPKVEVERLPSPSNAAEDSPQARLYVANTSRQNLETIVEAIRHLEGDHMFSDDPAPHRLNTSASSGNPNVPSANPAIATANPNPASTLSSALTSPAAVAMSAAVVERLHGADASKAEPTQEVPLALITNSRTQCAEQQRLLKVKVDPFLQFHPVTVQRTVQHSAVHSAVHSVQQQQRPGVIVEKQPT